MNLHPYIRQSFQDRCAFAEVLHLKSCSDNAASKTHVCSSSSDLQDRSRASWRQVLQYLLLLPQLGLHMHGLPCVIVSQSERVDELY